MPENMNRPHHARKTRSCSPEKTAGTRQQIARAALEEFSAQGFARASISNISKRAGVAKGTVYNYFPTKELLFEAVLKEFIATVRTELESSPPQRGNRKKAYLLRVMLPAVRKIDDASTGRARIAHRYDRREPVPGNRSGLFTGNTSATTASHDPTDSGSSISRRVKSRATALLPLFIAGSKLVWHGV